MHIDIVRNINPDGGTWTVMIEDSGETTITDDQGKVRHKSRDHKSMATHLAFALQHIGNMRQICAGYRLLDAAGGVSHD